MATINNPRFPHVCKIYRMGEPTPFDPGVEVILYEGECRKYVNRDRFNEVFISTYGLSIPGTIGNIKVGDLLNVTDPSGDFNECTIVRVSPGNLGTTIYFNSVGQ